MIHTIMKITGTAIMKNMKINTMETIMMNTTTVLMIIQNTMR